LSKAGYRRTPPPLTLPTLTEFAERAAKVVQTAAKDPALAAQLRDALLLEVVRLVAKSDMREDYPRLRALARIALDTVPPF